MSLDDMYAAFNPKEIENLIEDQISIQNADEFIQLSTENNPTEVFPTKLAHDYYKTQLPAGSSKTELSLHPESDTRMARTALVTKNTLDFDMLSIITKVMDRQDDKKLAELFKYSTLHWRVAAHHGVHPSLLTNDFLDDLITKGEMEYRDQCRRNGVQIVSQKKIDEDLAYLDKVLSEDNHSNIPDALNP